MSMWPALSLYLTITGRYRPGVHRSPPLEESAEETGDGISKICEKIHLEGNLCYLAFSKAIGLQKEELLGIDPWMEGSKPLFSSAVAKATA
jgi:hypothetical protein